MIYYVQDPKTRAIKIGTAVVVTRRFKQLEARYGKLELLGIHAGHRWTESCVHRNFDHHRVRRRSEWFWPGQDLLDHVMESCHHWRPDDDFDEEYDDEFAVLYWGEGRRWLMDLNKHCGADQPSQVHIIIQEALSIYAIQKGFIDPRPDRENLNKKFPPILGLPEAEDDPEEDESDEEVLDEILEPHVEPVCLEPWEAALEWI